MLFRSESLGDATSVRCRRRGRILSACLFFRWWWHLALANGSGTSTTNGLWLAAAGRMTTTNRATIGARNLEANPWTLIWPSSSYNKPYQGKAVCRFDPINLTCLGHGWEQGKIGSSDSTNLLLLADPLNNHMHACHVCTCTPRYTCTHPCR